MENAILVGLFSLASAIVSALVVLRAQAAERTTAYRSQLYKRQFDGLTELMASESDLFNHLIGEIGREMSGGLLPLSSEARGRLRQGMVEPWNKHATLGRKHSIIVPKSVAQALNAFETVAFAVTAPEVVASRYPDALVHSSDPQQDLATAHLRVLVAIRAALGVEELGGESARLIGGPLP